MRAMTFNRVCRLTIAASVLWFFVRPALADGPPMHGPLPCDPVCVHYVCAATCDGAQGYPGCYGDCQRRLTAGDCGPCREPAPEPIAPPGRPRPAP